MKGFLSAIELTKKYSPVFVDYWYNLKTCCIGQLKQKIAGQEICKITFLMESNLHFIIIQRQSVFLKAMSF